MTINTALRAILALLVVSLVGLIGWSLQDRSAREGERAPQFSIKTDHAQVVTPDSFGGKILVLNFWATWCPPCVQEIPSLSAFQKRFANSGVVVIAVSIDKNEKKYQTFLDHFRVAFDTARDPNADVSASYGTFQIPESYIIKDGRVLRKFGEAENWMSDDVTQYVQSLL